MVQAQQLPFRFQEVFKLTNLGLNPDLFSFGKLTFESQKYICVKDGSVSSYIILSGSPENVSDYERAEFWSPFSRFTYVCGIAMRDHRHDPELQGRTQRHEG